MTVFRRTARALITDPEQRILLLRIHDAVALNAADPGRCIWRRRKSLTDADGVTRAADERYFWCPVPSADLSDAGWSAQEHLLIRECRWWSVDDAGLRDIRIFPEGFLDAVHDLLRDGRPAEPRLLFS